MESQLRGIMVIKNLYLTMKDIGGSQGYKLLTNKGYSTQFKKNKKNQRARMKRKNKNKNKN